MTSVYGKTVTSDYGETMNSIYMKTVSSDCEETMERLTFDFGSL